MKSPLFGKTLAELSQVVKDLSLPAFSAKQIADWLYKKNVASIDEMLNLSVKARALLSEKYSIGVNEPLSEQTSKDGSRKYLFRALSTPPLSPSGSAEGGFERGTVETAVIPERTRATVCVSSQVGCRMGCAFCATAKQGMQGNLTANGMLNQFRSLPERQSISNIVFMGMGEPLDNMDELFKSLEILTSNYGYAMAPKRITVSTAGITPAIRYFMDNSRCNLAVSLNHPAAAERQKLMPIERKYPVKQVVELLKKYDLTRQQRISFEYVMIDGVNDSLQQANEISRLLAGLRCRVNLIRYHAISGREFAPSNEQVILRFAENLNRKGVITTVRRSRGQDISAACGMLSSK